MVYYAGRAWGQLLSEVALCGKDEGDFLWGEDSPFAFGEVLGEFQFTDGDACEFGDVVSGGCEHAADLVIATFVEGDEGFVLVELGEVSGEEGSCLAFEHHGSGGEGFRFVTGEGAIKPSVVGFRAI
jgi:hypothetical protein